MKIGIIEFINLMIKVIDDINELEKIIPDLESMPLIAIDTETTGLDPYKSNFDLHFMEIIYYGL